MDIPIGRPHHFDWIRGLIIAIFALNVADGILTLYWFRSGLAVEFNPIMEHLLNIGPVVFMAGKLTLVASGSALLWKFRDNPAAVTSVIALFLIYYFLLLHHLEALDLRLVRRWWE